MLCAFRDLHDSEPENYLNKNTITNIHKLSFIIKLLQILKHLFKENLVVLFLLR